MPQAIKSYFAAILLVLKQRYWSYMPDYFRITHSLARGGMYQLPIRRRI